MRQGGATFQKIGEALGVTRERARQLVTAWKLHNDRYMAHTGTVIATLQERLPAFLAATAPERGDLIRKWFPYRQWCNVIPHAPSRRMPMVKGRTS